LQSAWNRVCEKEKTWLKYKGHARNKSKLKAEYCSERKIFDKLNRQHKRKYQLTKQERLQETLDTNTPCDFWKEIGELGLSNDRKPKIPFEVKDNNGDILTDSDTVLHKWKHDYKYLYNAELCDKFDNNHLDTIKRQLQSLTVPVEYDSDITVLNAPITRTEVSEAILRAKL
jgi:hypothetical protein